MTSRSLKQNRPATSIIVGNSEAIMNLKRMIEVLASSDNSVLVYGESGTGKELVARELHEKSPRAQGPFVALNCAGVPETLIESELFGYEKGAFTGAIMARAGKFELAKRGTIFLDEIGEMSLWAQAKILRVLQEKEVARLGGRVEINLDIRVISATNKDLRKAVLQGTFREDLFYRLNVIPIEIPPLRERKEDIPLLVAHFLQNAGTRAHGGMTRQALDVLVGYAFPGNVRELENAVNHALTMSGGAEISVEDLPVYVRNGSSKERGRPDGKVRCDALLKAVNAIMLPCEGGAFKLWNRVLRGTSIENIYRFLVCTDGRGFSRQEFADYLSSSKNGRGAIHKYATAGRHLRILRNNGIVRHNGEKANATRYMLADDFLERS